MKDGKTITCYGHAPKQRSEPYQTSRLKCLTQPYDFCEECGRGSFELIVPDLRKMIRCPVGRLAELAKSNGFLPHLKEENPVLATDVRNALESGLAGATFEYQACILSGPFYTCTSCRGEEDYDPRRGRNPQGAQRQ